MEKKTLIIAVVEHEGKILMRKKPQGSKPYAQTWYLFGCEWVPGTTIPHLIAASILEQTGLIVEMIKDIGQDTAVKEDHDGCVKEFVYHDVLCRYVSGTITKQLPATTEKIAWVDRKHLKEYDLVPPTVKLLQRIGYV